MKILPAVVQAGELRPAHFGDKDPRNNPTSPYTLEELCDRDPTVIAVVVRNA